MFEVDTGYPGARELQRLGREGERAAIWRGHKLYWSYIDLIGGKASATCAVCGKAVNVVTRPAPNDIQISGEAVATGCDSRTDAYRLATKDLPAARDLEVLVTWREDLSDIWYIFEVGDGWFLSIGDFRGSKPEWSGDFIPSPRWTSAARLADVPATVRRKLETEIKRVRKAAKR